MIDKVIGIIGGSGFVGLELVSLLCKAGYRIKVFSRNSLSKHNLKLLGDIGQISIISGNVNNEKEATDIAENQNADLKYSRVWKEDKGDIEDQTVTVKEVVWSSEKNDFVDKQTEPQLKGYN